MDISKFMPTLPFTDPVLIFFIVLTVILFAPLLLNKLRIPHIIGLILAGTIFGPHGFDFLPYDSSFKIFGNVGLLYLMFLAGLEINLHDFRKVKTRGITFGIYTFIVPMILGTMSSHYLLHLDMPTSILLASMYASHTLVAYPIVMRYGIGRNPSVTITIAGTIIAVMGALIILAIIVGMQTGSIDQWFWIRLALSITIYATFILLAFPRIARWFFKKYNDSVSQYIFVLALVFLASALAKPAGLEPIIGAFFVGVVLNRFIPSVSPLMNRIEFVGNALFIPYFLIGVGMLINPSVIFSGWETLVVAVVMSVIATVSKWVAAWITQKQFKLSATDRLMIFGLSNGQAAATLAAVLIGYELGMFNDNILNGTIVMILVTCTISSFATERAAKEMATVLPSEESEKEKINIKDARILIPVANPDTLENLINFAILSKGNRRQLPIYALHVIDDNKTTQHSNAAGKQLLAHATKTAAASDTRVKGISRYDMNITSGIIHTIKEHNISEVVLGLHHKSNIVDSFFGSKIESLLNSTNKMVSIAKCVTPINMTTRIVVAVPEKAEYESGFTKWIDRIANIGREIGCRVIFYAHHDTITQIKAIIHHNHYNFRSEFEILDNWDDILTLTGVILQDDLFIIVTARHTSLSYNSEFEKLPLQLSRYFADNNIIVLYPEQFGEDNELHTFIDPLSSDVNRNYTRFMAIRDFLDKLHQRRKLWNHRRQNLK